MPFVSFHRRSEKALEEKASAPSQNANITHDNFDQPTPQVDLFMIDQT
jgi:hypothetical protein